MVCSSRVPINACLPSLDVGIKILDFNAAREFSSNERWSGLFGTSEEEESMGLPEVLTELKSILEQQAVLEREEMRAELEADIPNKIILEKRSAGETLVLGHIEKPVVEHIVKPVIVEETFRPEKIIEVQPVIHREVQAPEVHHIERHIYEKVEATGSHLITNKPIVEEVIRPHIIEEVQEIVHRELPAPVIEKVEKHITELEVLPTLHTKEVVLEKEEVFKADLVVEEEEVVVEAPVEILAEKLAQAALEASKADASLSGLSAGLGATLPKQSL